MFGMMEALLSFIRRQVGLRTDAASATGSLHAKIKDIKDIADNKIGTSDDDRADNTMMGWLNTPIKSWQRITFTPTDAGAYAVAISSVDPSKCIVLLDGCDVAFIADGVVQQAYTGVAINRFVSAFTATSIRVTRSNSWGNQSSFGNYSLVIVEFY